MPLLSIQRYRQTGQGGRWVRKTSDEGTEKTNAKKATSLEHDDSLTSLSPFGEDVVEAITGELTVDGKDESTTKRPHHDGDKGYKNPWPSFQNVGMGDVLTAFGLTKGGSADEAEEKDKTPSVTSRLSDLLARGVDSKPKDDPTVIAPPDFQKARSVPSSCRAIWLGHATYLVELPPPKHNTQATAKGVTLLFDPMFSMRSSPSQYVGPSRLVKPPCQVDELPPIDLVLISHNHYDHLDVDTITNLEAHGEKNSRPIHYFVPLGLQAWFTQTGIPKGRVTELDWWDDAIMSIELHGASKEAHRAVLDVLCVPAQHGSGRGMMDQNASLWASWYVSQGMSLRKSGDTNEKVGNEIERKDDPAFSVYFAGDTGYRYIPPQTSSLEVQMLARCPIFKQLAGLYRPPTLSLLPISNGSTLTYLKKWGISPASPHHLTSSIHSDPKDAVAIHLDLGAKYSCPMHYGTFVSGPEETLESLDHLKKACRDANVNILDYSGKRDGHQTVAPTKDIDTTHGLFCIPLLGQILEFPCQKEDEL